MMGKQNQQGGDSSLNFQSSGDIAVHVGLTVAEARTIALDVFRANALQLTREAAEIATARVNAMTDAFLARLATERHEALVALRDPDFQYTLFSAQRAYARSDDGQLADVLLEMLVQRAYAAPRSLIGIVLNESIEVVSKLTSVQIEILSVAFLLYHHVPHARVEDGLSTSDALRDFLRSTVAPFASSIRDATPVDFAHLVYVGCGVVEIGTTSLPRYFRQYFQHVLPDGLPDDDAELKRFILSMCPEIEMMFDSWESSSIRSLSLTSVGVMVGHANVRRRTGRSLFHGIAPKDL